MPDQWDYIKTTKNNFPGTGSGAGKILPEGTYVFKLLESSSNRTRWQIFNEDHTSLIQLYSHSNHGWTSGKKPFSRMTNVPADHPWPWPMVLSRRQLRQGNFLYPKSEGGNTFTLAIREKFFCGSDEYPKLQERNTETASKHLPKRRAARAPKPEPQTPPATRGETNASCEHRSRARHETATTHTEPDPSLLG